MNRASNRLASETSPYLLQHAQNPVDWYPWGAEALERARAEDKPIFLSIGYAACHWCHVMERESFENPAIAEFLNERFVAIKVDREERPDVDEIYMAATVALSGSGGWPMSVFLTPDQRPFFAGTYFPPVDRFGRPGFLTLLRRIDELWRNDRENVFAQAGELTRHVKLQAETTSPRAVSSETFEAFVREMARSFDPVWGGFGSAPKFPPHEGLRMLLRCHARSGDAHALEMVRKTLDGMKNGGIYDHVGGGFARYSTDERWLVPHFEKMLYDNAQLAVVYTEAFQVTGNPEYERVARETLDYVIREMQSSDGGYFSATDADSEGEEGKFFVFIPEEIDEILGKDDAEAFCAYYDVTLPGNWEGHNVLNTPRPLEEVASELRMGEEELRELLKRSREKVYAARKSRVPPLLDDKILTAWNGLMILAMAEGYRVFRDVRYLESARASARCVLSTLARPDGGLFRTARNGKAHIPAFLEDYAYFTDALVSLYEAGGDATFLDEAQRLAERLVADFSSAEGAFFQTASSGEALITRVREGHDGALPNANAVAARALARLAYHLDRPELVERATAALTAYGRLIERAPRAFATALGVVDFLLEGPTELVLVGLQGAPETEAFARELARCYVPNRLFVAVDPARPSTTPLTREKPAPDGGAALYICRNYACEAPLRSPSEVLGALDRRRAARSSAAVLERASTATAQSDAAR